MFDSAWYDCDSADSKRAAVVWALPIADHRILQNPGWIQPQPSSSSVSPSSDLSLRLIR